MRVLIVMPLAEQRGGAELTLWHLMQHAGRSEVRWRLVFLEDGPMVPQVQSLGIQAGVIRSGRLRELPRYLSSVVRIAGLARRAHVDAILSWMPKAHLYGGPAAVLAGVPAIWFQHGIPCLGSRIDRIVTALPARGVLTCSGAGAAAQARMRPVRPTEVVYPGVELERFDPGALPLPQEARRRLGLPVDGPLIGMVGRLQRWKGMHVLVEAMPAVLSAHPDAHCIFVGGRHSYEADYPEYLQRRMEALGLEDRVKLVGLQRNVPEWMQAMDIVVHASDCEPFGIVVLEAMALGKPVVAGCAGGPREIITEGVNGLLSPYGDAERLAGAVRQYLADPDFARAVGVAARERSQEFSTERFASKVEGAIGTMLRGQSRPARVFTGVPNR